MKYIPFFIIMISCHQDADDPIMNWHAPVFHPQNGEYTILYNKNNKDYVLQTGISSHPFYWLPLEVMDTAELNSMYFPVYFDSSASVYISDVKQATHFKDTATAGKIFKAYWNRIHKEERQKKVQDSIAAIIEQRQTDYRPINQLK